MYVGTVCQGKLDSHSIIWALIVFDCVIPTDITVTDLPADRNDFISLARENTIRLHVDKSSGCKEVYHCFVCPVKVKQCRSTHIAMTMLIMRKARRHPP